MRILLRPAASLMLAAVATTAANAQSQPDEDVEAHPVEELVVRGRLPGPAWWRVSDADSTVYVLGMPEALPKDMDWDETVLKRRLQGANGLITPPVVEASVSVFALPKLLWDARSATRSPTVISERLPPDLTARLHRASLAAGDDDEAFQHVPPLVAGLRLAATYHRKVGLDYREPLTAVRAAARRAGVRAAPAEAVHNKASALLQDVKALSDAVSRRCVEAAVSEVEAGDAPVRAAARAWAAGDVRLVLDRARSSELCLALLPGAGAAKRDSLDIQANAIQAALAKPGHSVAALSLRSVVARGGVLERLRARGLRVEAPE